MKCERDCFANYHGRCIALETGYEGKCPFQKEIGQMKHLYETNDDFKGYVDRYLKNHRDETLNYALATRIVRSYGENIINGR